MCAWHVSPRVSVQQVAYFAEQPLRVQAVCQVRLKLPADRIQAPQFVVTGLIHFLQDPLCALLLNSKET